MAEYSYDPWGNILESSGTFANEQPFRYASYYWDSEIGMYYLINRYYAPALRRFISRDPAVDTEIVEMPAASNPYAYTMNNPIMGIDADGLDWDGNASYHRRLSQTRDSQGEDVRTAQIQLQYTSFGHLLSPYYADGYFGTGTNNAILAFQRNIGITVDGVVGPVTWDRLMAYQGAGAIITNKPGANPVIGPTQTGAAGAPLVTPAPAPAAPSASAHTEARENLTAWFTSELRRVGSAARKIAVSRYYIGKKNARLLEEFKKLAGGLLYKESKPNGGIFETEYLTGADMGNLAYGYAGAAARYSQPLLTTAGGWKQKDKRPRDIFRRGERQEDEAMMIKGHNRWKRKHPGYSSWYMGHAEFFQVYVWPNKRLKDI